MSAAAARAASVLYLPKGAVALVATASTYTNMSVAGPPDEGTRARPGISALRHQPITLVTEAAMASLRAISARRDREIPELDPHRVRLGNEVFGVADKPGMTYELNQS